MPTSYTIYRGYPIYWRTTRHPDGNPQLVCYAVGVAGIWNSEAALKGYIDFVVRGKR